MFCMIWYHLYNFKNVKNTRGGKFLLIKLQAYQNYSSSVSVLHVFQIAQIALNRAKHLNCTFSQPLYKVLLETEMLCLNVLVVYYFSPKQWDFVNEIWASFKTKNERS